MTGIFAQWAPVYHRLGFEPRPIAADTKACKLKNWQQPIGDGAIASLVQSHGECGIGLMTGTKLQDGTYLVVLDIDHDAYIRIGWALMREPACARIGKKGVAIFCRCAVPLKSQVFSLPRELRAQFGNPAEILGARKLVVIPPTLHPDTGKPYRWTGRPLHELSPEQLPLIEV